MATSVVMPALEMAQETARLLSWHRREGEAVSRGDPLMEIETDKAVVDVEATADGVLAAVTAREGDVVAVGQVIAWIVAPGEQPPADAAKVASEVSGRTPMSPKARRLAAERALSVEGVRGSGPGGAVIASDLATLGGQPADTTSPGTTWRLMAERMVTSWTTVPHFFLVRDIDAGALAELRSRLNGSAGGEITYTDLLVMLTARALRRHPGVNASWVDGALRHHERVHIALATAVDQGVVAPVIHDADRLSVAGIAGRRREVIARARAGRLQPADLARGTFTISNLGMYGVDAFSALITPPQAAVLAVGRIADRVVARNGAPVIRPMATATLSCDHRVLDGAKAAAFLDDLATAIEAADESVVSLEP